jgi:alpha-galactosidase
MEDGSTAVGLFNIAEAQLKITVAWSQLGLTGLQRVRDLWRQQDVNDAKEQFTALVPRHGVALIRLWPKSTSQASK